MPTSDVLTGLKEYRDAMNGLDAELMESMGQKWLGIESRTKDNMVALAEKIAASENPSRGMIQQEARYQLLLEQMDKEITRFNGTAVGMIENTQREGAMLGINSAQNAIFNSFEDPLSATFTRINLDAVEAMIGISKDGSPLADLLEKDFGEAVTGMTDALLQGVVEGQGAEQVARDMADGMGIGLDRSLTIARTEINRAYRTGQSEQYRESGIVTHQKRLAARNEACIGCLMLDGEIVPIEEEIEDHPNGRCTGVPIIPGLPEPTWETGKEWLANQDEAKQLAILGDTRFNMYKNGLDLSAFASKTNDPVWGSYPKVTSIKDLLEASPLPILPDKVTVDEISLSSAVGLISENSPINLDLRRGIELDSVSQQLVQTLDANMQPLTSDRTLYRGINAGTTREQTLAIFGTDSPKIGTVFTEPGYSSTSIEKQIAISFANKGGENSWPVLYEIVKPKGALGLNLGEFAQHSEAEILLARDTTFKIIGRSSIGQTTVYKLMILSKP